MNCPKCKNVSLIDGTLAGHLAVKQCMECKGTWIPASEYEAWQASLAQLPSVDPELLSQTLPVDFVQSPFDTKAALCPECRRYLSRAKVKLKTPFYVERCLTCEGIWCDYGEWDVLSKLGLHATIEQLFSNEWQARVEKQQQSEKEREATTEKLGSDLATRVFELAELLAKHPNGDFGVAYLMRRVGVTK
ncbi:zf-TFIIB domain-containing protein [Microcoleus sp. FACHB-831]|uniref:TFIIB-type zinc ribbon-containing protein n=1 Tax=Microcoleus sp. FACHB-831 TaxID=2692827 RepID=UPI0016861733|nr:zf-TFIIB domain-containing protein [Microcoleus sp. FACHB-831]MBD1923796.1 zf-TFIIB domain-containing protein [Microcoleus sp. FACHB-831]